MNELGNINALAVRQERRIAEVLTGFEAKNKYLIFDQNGKQVFLAEEIGKNLMTRVFLKSGRPFTIEVNNPAEKKVISVVSPFRFYFRECSVLDEYDMPIGTIKRTFSMFRKSYSVIEVNGMELFTIETSVRNPWTFNVKRSGQKVALITKEWSGFLKEAFTDADNFGVVFEASMNEREKALLLGAVFLIDYVHFEHHS